MDSFIQNRRREIVLTLISCTFLLLILLPWIITVILLFFGLGYLAILHFESYIDKLLRLIQARLGVRVTILQSSLPQKWRTTVKSQSSRNRKVLELDPLSQHDGEKNPTPNVDGVECSVCARKNCQRNAECHSHNKKNKTSNVKVSISKSPEKFTPTPYQPPKIDDLKIDPRLDASIGRFCTSVFDFYISTEWAPYLTRKQLRLAMKQLFASLGTRVNDRLQNNPKWATEIFMRKLIPLGLHYVKKIKKGTKAEVEQIFPPDKQHFERFRIRQLCTVILQGSIVNEEERNCKLWMELCVSVLSDGVFWNLFELGRDRIPELVSEYVKEHVIDGPGPGPTEEERVESQTQTSPSAEIPGIPEVRSDPPIRGYDETDSDIKSKSDAEKVPFLLNSFLDPKESMEQPDPILSRWKPTLRDIIDETELLYPLIQYLKHVGGQKALAYLQAVLDDSPDAKVYCSRILEVEYLPGFCRSIYFQESFGLSRIEQGMEVKMDQSPESSRRMKGHFRSSSYGSKSNQAISDLLKMEGGVVDGLPLYSTIDGKYGAPPFTGLGYSSSGGNIQLGESEVDSSGFSFFGVGRKKTSIEDVISKFIKSSSSYSMGRSTSTDNGFSPSPTGDEPIKAMRIGIDAKRFDGESHPEATKRVEVTEDHCDIFCAFSDILTSSITANWGLGPLISSWVAFLRPFLQPIFISKLESSLDDNLTLDLCVDAVDLITKAFNSSNYPADAPVQIFNSSYSAKSKANYKSKDNVQANPNLRSNPSSSSLQEEEKKSFSSDNPAPGSVPVNPVIKINATKSKSQRTTVQKTFQFFMMNVFNLDKDLVALSTNRDFLFLFFADLLDILVGELFGNVYDNDTQMINVDGSTSNKCSTMSDNQ